MYTFKGCFCIEESGLKHRLAFEVVALQVPEPAMAEVVLGYTFARKD